MSRRLATIEMESPVDFDPSAFQIKPPQMEPLSDLLRELEFTSLLKSFQASNEPPKAKQAVAAIIESARAAQAFVDSLPAHGTLAVECLRSGGTGITMDVHGIALSSGDKTAYIPLDVHEYMRPIT
ncbi:MAG: hypothetical protein HP490_16075, partial [Nitrospira sp.]|nr:hypothetical protein [Nitrospira sp.]